jgi:mannosidase alpha-like ER degradation enhancer 2
MKTVSLTAASGRGATGIARMLALALLLLCFAVSCRNSSSEPRSPIKNAQADLVKKEFLHAWNGYKQYAWGHDMLRPLTKTHHDWYGESLLMTPLDALSAMKLMELDAEYAEAKQLILETLSFDKDMEVQVFEINIRSLGSLLSAYQSDGDKRFLDLAIDLADRLMPAFDSPTGMPYRYVHLQTGAARDHLNNPAEIGTLLLEFGTLSKITGNPAYYQKAKDAVVTMYKKRSQLDLVGTVIDVESGEWVNTESHLSGRIDSYYEYLYKAWLMFGDKDMKEMWNTSIKAINTCLADESANGLWYGWVDMYTQERLHTWFGALDAFFPAVLALSGDVERAKRLQDNCYAMWMLHGIEPEMIDYVTMKPVSNAYVLRPENIESVYYLYYYTGDPAYFRMGTEYFESLLEHCRNDVAYAHLSDVVTMEQADAMESFFLAETLKYFYLLFAPRSTLNLDRVVLNTEAHPLKRWN